MDSSEPDAEAVRTIVSTPCAAVASPTARAEAVTASGRRCAALQSAAADSTCFFCVPNRSTERSAGLPASSVTSGAAGIGKVVNQILDLRGEFRLGAEPKQIDQGRVIGRGDFLAAHQKPSHGNSNHGGLGGEPFFLQEFLQSRPKFGGLRVRYSGRIDEFFEQRDARLRRRGCLRRQERFFSQRQSDHFSRAQHPLGLPHDLIAPLIECFHCLAFTTIGFHYGFSGFPPSDPVIELPE